MFVFGIIIFICLLVGFMFIIVYEAILEKNFKIEKKYYDLSKYTEPTPDIFSRLKEISNVFNRHTIMSEDGKIYSINEYIINSVDDIEVIIKEKEN